ncbi:MAG: autotransporter domain-containing protein [Pseudomonadota bacterium]
MGLHLKGLMAGAGLAALTATGLFAEGALAPAQALSNDCATFSINATIGIGIGDSASSQYTLEAGEQITFNVTLPAGTTIEIIGFGASETLSASGSVTITVPNTGATSTGSFIFRVNSTDLNTQVQIDATCAGVQAGGGGNQGGGNQGNNAIDANAVANVIDSQVQGALPGGNDGSVVDDFGLNASALFFDEVLRIQAIIEGIFPSDQEIGELITESLALGRQQDELEAEAQSLEIFLAGTTPSDAPRREVEAADQNLTEAVQTRSEIFDILENPQSVGEGITSQQIADRAREANADVVAAQQRFDQASQAAEDAARAEVQLIPERARAEARLNQVNQLLEANQNRQDEINATLSVTLSGFFYAAPEGNVLDAHPFPSPLRVTQSGISGRFDFRTWQKQQAVQQFLMAHQHSRMATSDPVSRSPFFAPTPKFNAWIEGSVTFHHVEADNRDEDGYTAAVAGGVSYRFAERWEAGLVGRYAHSDREGNTAETELDVWSMGAFAQGIVGNGVLLQGIATASFGSGDTILDPAATRPTGNFDITAYQAQVKASRKFVSGRWWFEPNASVTLSHMIRDGFTASDGTVVPETDSTRFTASLGPTIGANLIAGSTIFTPYVGANLFLTAVDQPDRNTPLDSADTSVGVTGRAGLGMTFANGASLGLDGTLTFYDEDAVDVGASARLKVPFGKAR